MSKIICLMGPTACGKSDLAIQWAKRHPIEIVSVDSALVYQGMDIGTAKPSQAEREEVPHHLIDLCDPSDVYSVGQFYQDAKQAITAINSRGHLPVLVGGTMMYFHALYRGLAELPAKNDAIREEIAHKAEQFGWPHLHKQLAEIDQQAADTIHENDAQRISRALEVYYQSGKTITQLTQATRSFLGGADVVNIAIMPQDRAALEQTIRQRLDHMMITGFKDEVSGFKERGDLSMSLPAFRAVGYRQMWQHLEGEFSLDEAYERIVIATRQLAKRQMTWLRMFKKQQADFKVVTSALECQEFPLFT